MAMLDCGGRRLDLNRVALMGVLNITPDSFSDGGDFYSVESAIRHAHQMVQDGADIIDVGGESTRPGAKSVSVEQELERVIPVIKALVGEIPVPISVDTMKPEVMRAAVDAGAGMINDVRALQQPGALDVAAEMGVPVCLMHMQGEPRSMQANPVYQDVVQEVTNFLAQRRAACIDAGIKPEHIVVDPGFGFGKSVAHNLQLLRQLYAFKDLASPILVGLSRKSLIGKVLGTPVEQRLPASLALAVLAVQRGAAIVRAHDVAATYQAVRMAEAVLHENMAAVS